MLQRQIVGHHIPPHQRTNAVGIVLRADHAILRQIGKTLMGQPRQGIFLQQAVLFLTQHQLPLMQEGDVVADLLQIADDVGGQQNGTILLPGVLVEDIQNFIPYHGIEAAGGFVQNQQLCLMGQSHGDGQLHFHAA